MAQPVPKLIDIGNRGLEVLQMGSGNPTVVLEAPGTFDLTVWNEVIPHISPHATVVAYSRAGLGNSDGADYALSISDKVRDLNILLDVLQIERPVVIAGNSLGSLLARTYARTFPEQVAGLVLIDGTHERQYLDFAKEFEDFWSIIDETTASLANESIGKQQEWDAWLEVARSGELPVSQELPDIPMAVLTALKPEKGNLSETALGREIWRRLHDEWFAKTTDGLRIVSSRSLHVMPESEPMIVVEAINWVVNRVRSIVN